MERETSGEVEAFAAFARGPLADGVHSGSGRTSPRDDHTDYYPVALSRETIPPGTMYADPYGHLYVIARWEPQTVGGYGKLIGADGQPDGTIGRRRFWRGSFLFTPDTTLAGAGFKHFRPTVLGGGAIKALGNDAIAGRAGYPPPSMQQYEVDQDGFYDAVEGLINPRPLDPSAMLEVLVAALSEQVQRRVVSIDIGEKYKASHPGAIAMPSGHAIFETEGPWEDFATPSRDMRLLIAIDTVTGFPAVVRRRPERYAVSADRAETAAAALRAELGRRLGASRFAYTRSDGQSQSLSLQDVVDRAAGLEVAYNPNDCVEVRWAAPEGPGERAGCKRLAPAEQRKRMAEYRRWFAERKRPPR
jgi:hypothetical protein